MAVALVLVVVAAIVIAGIQSARDAVGGCPSGQFCVTVTHWATGSPDVSGTITNATGGGCTDPEITLYLRDHNDAIVRRFTFGAGDTASKTQRQWTTHMVGLFFVDAPAEATVTHITADAVCADQR